MAVTVAILTGSAGSVLAGLLIPAIVTEPLEMSLAYSWQARAQASACFHSRRRERAYFAAPCVGGTHRVGAAMRRGSSVFQSAGITQLSRAASASPSLHNTTQRRQVPSWIVVLVVSIFLVAEEPAVPPSPAARLQRARHSPLAHFPPLCPRERVSAAPPCLPPWAACARCAFASLVRSSRANFFRSLAPRHTPAPPTHTEKLHIPIIHPIIQ